VIGGKKMIEVGRLVLKIAGRDANKKGVIIKILDDNYVIIDGQVRRRKCNILHLEPLNKLLKVKDKSTHDEIVKLLKSEGIEVVEKKGKDKPKTEKPKKQRKGKKKVETSVEEKPKVKDANKENKSVAKKGAKKTE
jgi:large subunit ribosomal protein L14e